MAWRSDEYIGPNGAELEFTSADGVGSRMTSSINPDTFATLIRVNGNRVVESALSLTALDSIPTASVICSEVGQGASTIAFTLLGMWSYLAIIPGAYEPLKVAKERVTKLACHRNANARTELGMAVRVCVWTRAFPIDAQFPNMESI
jgi:hypothetical protein